MKKIYITAVLAVFVQGISGAARSNSLPLASSSSSSSSSSSVAIKTANLPYLELLLNPGAILSDDRYFSGEDYERNDLMAYALSEGRLLGLTRINELSDLMSRIGSLGATGNVSKLLSASSFALPVQLDAAIELLRLALGAATMEDAVRQLVGRALKQRLKSAGDNEILRAYFSPLYPSMNHTKVEETILWLIRSENKSIKVASYYLTNPFIIFELWHAMNRGVDVDIIVDGSSLQKELRESPLPYKTWKHQYDSELLMHHKFILFESNIDGDSIVVNGSFNLTDKANRNHENIIVFNNKDLYQQFLSRFDFVAKYAKSARMYDSGMYDYGSSSDDFYFEDDGINPFESPVNSTAEIKYQKGLQIAKELLQHLEDLRFMHTLDDNQFATPESSLWNPEAKRPRSN